MKKKRRKMPVILASIFGRVPKSFVFKNSKSDDESKPLLNNVTKIGYNIEENSFLVVFFYTVLVPRAIQARSLLYGVVA